MDIDNQMPAEEIESYINSIVHEYAELLAKHVNKLAQGHAIITYRKVKRIKKHVLFTLLKKVTNKNE